MYIYVKLDYYSLKCSVHIFVSVALLSAVVFTNVPRENVRQQNLLESFDLNTTLSTSKEVMPEQFGKHLPIHVLDMSQLI